METPKFQLKEDASTTAADLIAQQKAFESQRVDMIQKILFQRDEAIKNHEVLLTQFSADLKALGYVRKRAPNGAKKDKKPSKSATKVE